MNNLHDLDITCELNGTNFTVVKVLENDLWLVVETEKLKERSFPLATFIIPEQF